MNFKTVGEVGEFKLIERIQQLLPQTIHPDLTLGIGDDTAVIKIDENRSLLITCDIQVENQHFRLNNIDPGQLGRRAMAVNLSDIAAMGGQPTFALISLGLPKSFPANDFECLLQGMRDQLAEFSAMIIGGNLSNTEKDLIIDITLLGEVKSRQFITRSGAKPGDRIFVTGHPGASAAGYWTLEKFGRTVPAELSHLVQKHLQPIPRIRAGQRIAQSGFTTAMIDVSDGIAGDLHHICEQSRVGAEVYQRCLPLPEGIQQVSAFSGKSVIELALQSGEDYELLFTVKPETSISAIDAITAETGVPITEVGKILPKDAGYFLVDSENNRLKLQTKGWNHFRQH